jgi:hypothetical protein
MPAVRQAASAQQELDRGGGVVLADEDRRVVGVERERLLMCHLLHGAEEAVDRRLVVRAVDPLVRGAELELGDVVVALHGVDRGEQGRGVDTVAGLVLDGGHRSVSLDWVMRVMSRATSHHSDAETWRRSEERVKGDLHRVFKTANESRARCST